MGQRNMYNDVTVDMGEQNSLVIYGNTFDTAMSSSSALNFFNSGHDQTMYGSFGPSLIQGESSNLRDFYQSGYEVPNQLNQSQSFSHYMEGMAAPLSAPSFSTILGLPRSDNSSIDDSNHSNSSTQTSLKWGSDILCPTGVKPFGSMVNIDPQPWILTSHQDTNFRADCIGLSMLNQELSLSLATANPNIQDQYSDMGCSSNNNQYNGCLSSEQTPSSKNQSWRYNNSQQQQQPQIFSCSTYVHALQEILAALASYSIGNFDEMNNHGSGTDVLAGEDPSITVQRVLNGHGSGIERKKKRLLALLQMVDKQYSQCADEIHTTVSAFHAVTELNPHIHARFALQTISNLYRKLREKISNHIISMGVNVNVNVNVNNNGKEEEEAIIIMMEEDNNNKSFEASFIQRQWAIQQLRQRDNHLFRPQRGLPERSVSVLKAWMFQNFLHPYPKDAEKHLLAVKSGLSRSQVSNWFINARVRIWKPMIEEMYAEMNRRRVLQSDIEEENDDNNNNKKISHVTLENQRYSHY